MNNLQDKIESYAKFYIFSINSFALSEVNWDSNISSVFENCKVNAKAYWYKQGDEFKYFRKVSKQLGKFHYWMNHYEAIDGIWTK